MVDVVLGKRAALAVLEPLLSRAVAADGGRPDFRLDTLEILFAIDPDVPRQTAARRRVTHLVHLVATSTGERRRYVPVIGLHKMQADQAIAGDDESGERRPVGWQRNAWEVGLQEVSVAATVFRAVEHGVEVAEDVLRTEGAGAVTSTIRNEVETDGGCKRSSELGVEVRCPRVDSVRQPLA